MSMTVCVWWCLSVCWIVVNGQNLGLNDGRVKELCSVSRDVCNDVKDERWICKKIRNCPKAREEIKIGKNPVMCGFNGTEPILCCKSQVKNAKTVNTVSERGCDVCLDVKDELRIWQRIENYTKALEEIKICNNPMTCSLNGTEPIVCCESQVKEVLTGNKIRERNGNFCKIAAGASWTCETVKNCPTAVKVIQEGGKWPEICGLNKDLDVTVCCEPEVGIGAKSIEMCKKYAESVFIRLPDVLGDGEIISYDTCGFKPNTTSRVKRLVDGTESKSREYPHMALIGYKNKTAPYWRCGGTLISERFVLTTAHCTVNTGEVGPPIIVRLGDLNIQSETDEDESVSQPTEYEVVEILPHPDYKPPSLYNDIALLKLDRDVFFTEFIRPICLQTAHRLPTTYGLATGWGRTEWGGSRSSFLLTINISVYTQDKCNTAYNKSKDKLKDGISEATMLCAGDRESSKHTCQGDLGGPLQIPLQEPYCMYSQVGITSFGVTCGGQKPTLFTRVSHFIPWIESIVWP